MIDIGANLTHASFHDDLEAVVARAKSAGVWPIVVTGTTVLESRLAAEIADRFGLYATAGVHPHHARDLSSDTVAELRKVASHAAWTSTATIRRIPTRRMASSRS